MNRRREKKTPDWNFSKNGSFGHFKTDVSVPIEYVMTTFTTDQLSKLSFARNIQTELNFDLLIQRDIDEKRAIEEISQYISPKDETKKRDEIVFLPPLLVAVVGTKQGKQLIEYYPNEHTVKDKDEYSDIYLREWGTLFRVTYYPQEDGYEISLEIDGLKELKKTIEKTNTPVLVLNNN